MMNDLNLDNEGTQKYCDTLKGQILLNYRFLLYIEHLTSIKEVSIDQLVFLRKCGFGYKEIADLFHCSTAAVGARLKKYSPENDETIKLQQSLAAQITDVRIDNPIESLESKWQQLSAMRLSKNEETVLKAIKLQVDIEEKMYHEKDKLISEERLRRFIGTIEAKVIEADNWLRNEIGQANKYLESLNSTYRIPYQPIAVRVKDAIESDTELSATRNALAGAAIDITPEEDELD
jgi:predicted transcriptional regulator